jgi:Uma2 family endonuclease
MTTPDPKPPSKKVTYQDLLDLPENLIAEIINGELVGSPRPSGANTLAASALCAEVGPPFQFGKGGGPGGWWILFEPELEFERDRNHLVPDLAGWRRDRMPEIPQDHIFRVIPDWVCEVVSDSSRTRDRVAKFNIYAAKGVAYYWIIEPQAQSLEAFELVGGRWLSLGAFSGATKVRVAPFAAVEIDLALLWSAPAGVDVR